MLGLFMDMLERRFPSEFQSTLVQLSFNCIFIYSKMQIYFNKFNRKVNDYIETNPTLLKIKNEIKSHIISNKETTYNKRFVNNGIKYTEKPDNYDFIIYSWLNENRDCNNIKVVYDENEEFVVSECSDFKFILLELQIGDKPYKIDLKNDYWNFYLVGNKFTRQFFVYFIKTHTDINEHIDETTKIIIKIIDHNVYSFDLEFTDKNESIIIEKTGYKILLTEDKIE